MNNEHSLELFKYAYDLQVQGVQMTEKTLKRLYDIGREIIMNADKPLMFALNPNMRSLTHAKVDLEIIQWLEQSLGIRFVRSGNLFITSYKDILIVFGV